jgi:formate hydrogenlyase subunit 3/multisubunit Na+/H+ antiporter MnhD subunit
MLYDRRHTRLIKEFGGLGTTVPVFSTFFMIVTLSSLGLPMLNGFIGEFLIILGSFHARAVFGSLAAVGVILAAVYLLWMYQRVFLGEVTNEKNREIPDCNARERWMLAATVAVIIFMGVYPQPFLRQMDTSVSRVIERVNPENLTARSGLGTRGSAFGTYERPSKHGPTAWELIRTGYSGFGGSRRATPESRDPSRETRDTSPRSRVPNGAGGTAR